MFKKIAVFTVFTVVLTALPSLAQKVELSAKKVDMPQQTTSQFTLGLVQSTLRAGMSQPDVLTFLGSPNMATRDADGKDCWVYDKIYTEKSSLNHDAAAGIILVGWNRSSKRESQVQKTITVIVKFDKNQKVESYTYHNSQF